MNPLQQMALNLIQNNKNIQASPIGQQFTQILQSGNAQAGEALANNILQSYGLSKEEAIKQATEGLRQKGLRF